MNILDLLTKYQQVRDALTQGDYLTAARIVYQLIGVFLADNGPVGAPGDCNVTTAQFEDCCRECQAILANPPRGGMFDGVLVEILQLVIPLVVELVKKRIDALNTTIQPN